ncbi:MAG: transglycosylase SLT domain-containing protein [Legionella sp.]|nr:transglycosylase SLT domain-containing protein [Legionella sp.]
MKFKWFIITFFFLFTLPGFSEAQAVNDVWAALRQGCHLNYEVRRPEVQKQIRWLVAHPGYIQTACRQSEPYIYHILKELKQRNLPAELALLPMIESAYNPFAYSNKGAAGLWQLMPATGGDLGLRQDWWYDGRRGIRSSTDAALNYLRYLNKLVSGNWILTIAAYDAGGGAISRAIKPFENAHRPYDVWSIQLPRETQIYVPRFLALVELIKNPQQYKIQLPRIAYQPYFEEVNVGSQIDLSRAAKLAGISYKELIKLNPGYNRWATAPYQPFNLLIPKQMVQSFNFNLAHMPMDKRISWIKHQIMPGDNLANIAYRYHTTENLIKQLNLLKSKGLQTGHVILIPSSIHTPAIVMTQSASPLKPRIIESKKRRLIHIVQPHESYKILERLYGVSSKEIQVWNNLSSNQPLQPGQQLILWKVSTT